MARLTAATAHDFVLAQVDREFALDPYPDYAMLRAHAPLCRQPDGSVLLTRYEDVREVLGDSARFSSDKRVDFKPRFGDSPLYEHHTTTIVFNDPPYHTRVRRLLAPFFAARVLRQMETSIAAMVDSLLDRAAAHVLELVQSAPSVPAALATDLGTHAACAHHQSIHSTSEVAHGIEIHYHRRLLQHEAG